MSDNTRREAASADLPHPARDPHPPQCLPVPRAGSWPDARTAEILLTGDGSCAPPSVPADRLVRLLAAARGGRAPLDPVREAAALAAFRTAAVGRARGKGGGPLAALRAAFTVRRPRVMAAAVMSALALGGVAVGMAAVARSFTPGEGAGNAPVGTRPPAAVSPDSSTSGPWTAGPRINGGVSAPPPAHSGVDEQRRGAGHEGRGHSCHRTHPGHCPGGRSGGKADWPASQGGGGKGGKGATGGKGGKADKRHGGGGPRHIRPGRHSASRAPGR
ncbi:hypothetical protein [Streptomyces sp. NPDC049040]|uniref:hypothetical protein n=1 Tax=Streptomyces sp. NPDC049040 TaxID=3365593 RepID=UPI00370FE696